MWSIWIRLAGPDWVRVHSGFASAEEAAVALLVWGRTVTDLNGAKVERDEQ